MTPSRVDAREWRWRFATRSSPAVSSATFSVEAGECVLLAGPSGSGKSTLLAGLAGVLGDDTGDSDGVLLVDGHPPRRGSGRVGLVLQDPESQIVMSTVGDDVAFGAENRGVARSEIWSRVADALDMVNLRVDLATRTDWLSGGQQQRLALAGALVMRPGLLLLDEPTANIDPEGARSVIAAVARLRAQTGCTVIVVDHDAEAWRPLVNRVIRFTATGAIDDSNADYPTPARDLTRSKKDVFSLPPVVATQHLHVGRRGHPDIPMPPLQIHSGSLTAITGANGVGKTTFALTLGGLLPARSGAFVFAESIREGLPSSIAARPWRWRSVALATRIASVFQTPGYQFVRSTVRAELQLAVRLQNPVAAVSNAVIDETLVRLGLDQLAQAHPLTLSGGQQRRLSLATALLTRPPLLVADEPTFGQDDETWREVVSMLLELTQDGTAVVAATHDRHLIALSDSVVSLGVNEGIVA